MGKINVQRWLAGGVAAGVLVWLLEGLGSTLYMSDMQAALAAHNMSYEMNAKAMTLSVVMSLVVGLTLVWFYAAARPRFGPGPRTAVLVALVFWIGSYTPTLLGFHLLGLFPDGMLVQWAIMVGVEMVAAANLGGWIYREA